MNNQSLGFNQLFKGMAGKPDTTTSGNDNGMPDMNQFNAIYDFQSHDGLISRKLNPEKWKALAAESTVCTNERCGKYGHFNSLYLNHYYSTARQENRQQSGQTFPRQEKSHHTI